MNRPVSNTFKYSNKVYTIIANLFTSTGSQDNDLQISLDPIDIEEIVYEGKLNDLMLKGHIIYLDKYARVDRMMNWHFGYAHIMFSLNKRETDDQIGIGEIDDENKFAHNFIITNIKVIARNTSLIKYQIDILTTNWFKCTSNIYYSNYSVGAQPIVEIMKNCISMSDIAVDDTTFNKVKVPLNIDYISQANDNLFSVMKYLMHKLYYFPTKDDSVKFFVYDWFKDNVRMLDLKDKNTALGTYGTILSMFKTNTESLIQQEPTNIGSFKSPMPKTDAYQNAFKRETFMYNFNMDSFSIDEIPPDQTINYFNNKIDNGNYELRYQKMFDVPNQKYIEFGSYWNNHLDVYNNAVHMLEENNSLILNITGEIKRQPGTFTVISLDRDLKNLTNDTPQELEKMKQKYKAYEGVWMASKVRNIICPSAQTFRQQVVLFRNFIPKIQAV